MRVGRRDTGARVVPASLRCSAAVAGRALRAVARRSLGYAECAWRIPARTTGKKLRGTVTVAYDGSSVRRSFTRTIR